MDKTNYISFEEFYQYSIAEKQTEKEILAEVKKLLEKEWKEVPVGTV